MQAPEIDPRDVRLLRDPGAPSDQRKGAIDRFVFATRAFHARMWPDALTRASCMTMALSVVMMGKRNGLRIIHQAGSAFWRRAAPDFYFGYEWEEDSPVTAQRLSQGMLPEIHVWNGNPDTGEFIDLTSGYFQSQCRVILGEPWTEPDPPDYLWASQQDQPPGAIYMVSRSATIVTGQLMVELVKRNKH